MTRPSKFIPADVRHGQALSDEARQAIIEHRRLMKDQRAWERANRERLDAEWNALPDGRPWRLEDHIRGFRARSVNTPQDQGAGHG